MKQTDDTFDTFTQTRRGENARDVHLYRKRTDWEQKDPARGASQASRIYSSLLATTGYQDTTELSAKIHKFSHAYPDEIKEILSDKVRLREESSRACEKDFQS